MTEENITTTEETTAFTDIEDMTPEQLADYGKSIESDDLTLTDADGESESPADDEGADDKDVDEEPTQEDDEEKPKKRKGWGEREREAKIAAQREADEAKREKIILAEENRKLKELLESKLGKKPEPQDIDAELREYNIDPDTVVDKEALLAVLKNGKQTEQSLQQIQQQIEGQRITDAFKQSIVATPDAAEAIAYYGQIKQAEALAVAEQLGMTCTAEDAANAAAQKANELVALAVRNGKDPAQVLLNAAKAVGFKGKGLTTGKKIDYNALNDLRATAGKPAIDTESTASLNGQDFTSAYITKKGHDANAW